MCFLCTIDNMSTCFFYNIIDHIFFRQHILSFNSNILSEKNNLTTKIKLYTTSEFISNDISFEKKILLQK